MENKCYLLSVKELGEENAGERLSRVVFDRMDKDRREKTERMRYGAGRAASLGAGLILQLAVQEALKETVESREPGNRRTDAQKIEGKKPGDRKPEDRKPKDKKSEDRRIGDREPEDRKTGGKKLAIEERKSEVKKDYDRNAEKKLTMYTVSQVLKQLGEPIELNLDYGRNGKPYLRDYPFYFNLSHSGEYVFCAISNREVGVDIQQFRPADEVRLARRFFSEEERKALETCLNRKEQRELFYRLWARKEAYGKLTGEGIAASVGRSVLPTDELPPWKVELCAQQSADKVMAKAGNEASLYWQEWGLSEYRIALCQFMA